MAVGDRVALRDGVCRRTERTCRWSDDELILLGHLVGDGSYLNHQPLRYTTARRKTAPRFATAAEALGSTVTRHAGRGLWHQLVIAGNGNRWHAKGVGRLAQEARHLQSAVAREAYSGRRVRAAERPDRTATAHLWATDGCIHVRGSGRGSNRVYFATCSQGLALDVAALLMRFGIVARMRSTIQARWSTGAQRRCLGHGAAETVHLRKSAFSVRACRRPSELVLRLEAVSR